MPHVRQEEHLRTGSHRQALLGFLALASLALFDGCTHCCKRPVWEDPECSYQQTIRSTCEKSPCVFCSRRLPSGAESEAVRLAQHASSLEISGNPACVDAYYAAAVAGWRELATFGAEMATVDVTDFAEPYNAVVAKLLVTAERFGRFDGAGGLRIVEDGCERLVPVEFRGFAWLPEDFNQLELVGKYRVEQIPRPRHRAGVGVPLVVKRIGCDQFYRAVHPFAATAVLCAADSPEAGECGFVLRYYNPDQGAKFTTAERRWPLAGDMTAPLAWQLVNSPNKPVLEYLRPDAPGSQAQLVMLEPYQCGKIPVVFVHGLLSDPTTWVKLGNQLRGEKWFRDRYQAWTFRYPTGEAFLVSAATLRRELNAAIYSSPEAASDPAAQQMVLIGHSMGGLVAKLQVADSGETLWNLVSNQPLDAIQASDADRQRLREVFYFEAQPFIRRVIFIGTPHRGSVLARRGVGRVGSLLAHSSTTADDRQRELVAANPNTFAPWIRKRIPTSVDLLEPGHPLLVGIEHLCVPPTVELHSIIGVAKVHLHHSGDGVVPLDSAVYPGVESQQLVSEKHEELHHAAATVAEIERILRAHLPQCDRSLVGGLAP